MNFPQNHYELKDSMDLYPLVASLYGEIISRIEDSDDRPLVVLMGEEHSTPSHILAQIALLDYLVAYFQEDIEKGKKPIVWGEEISYQHKAINTLGLAGVLDQVTDVSFFDRMLHFDPDQHVLSLANSVTHSATAAPLSRKMLMSSLLSYGIPIACVDAYTQGEDLVAYDPLAVDVADELYDLDLSQTPLKASPDYTDNQDTRGITVRNVVQAHRVKERVLQSDAKVMIVPYGLSHIYGNNHSGQLYQNAVMPLLQQEGLRTLGVVLMGAGSRDMMLGAIPDEAYVENDQDVLFENVIDTAIKDYKWHGVEGAEAEEWREEGIFDVENEAAFIEMLAQEYSSEDPCPFYFSPQMPDEEEVLVMARDLFQRTRRSLEPAKKKAFLLG
ncbi:MAG: hypothetical protein HRT94_07700 [Alphaproteobacteria bacterium]|nr:hypothetical protein [Alphaproteobacteria bacterium]